MELRAMTFYTQLHHAASYPVGRANHTTAHTIGECAGRALLTELLLTPKPGLVDRRNNGAQRDMDLYISLQGAHAIAPWWPRFVRLGYLSACVPSGTALGLVRPAGMLCEQAMSRATKGINTHKGTIFSVGLLCVAAGRLLASRVAITRERVCSEIASMCVGVVERELDGAHEPHTAGEQAFELYGLTGVRGEAASGFETVRKTALPVYDYLRLKGVRDDILLLQVLLHLLAASDDTNLVSRGGIAGLDYVQTHARRLLEEGGVLASDGLRKMEAFDDSLIARNLSPGGSAVLLGITRFLAQFSADDGLTPITYSRHPKVFHVPNQDRDEA
jgi:triphosphoribosyl-dephospho-CoA synthase